MATLPTLFVNGLKREYPKGQILLYQGERTLNVYYIEKGYVKIYDIDVQGNEKLLLILGPGDIFPIVWAFEYSEPIHYFYETYSDVTLRSVEREAMVKRVEDEHKVAQEMLRYFVLRIKQLMSRIECIEATSAFHKVAQVLSYLAEAHGTKIAKDAYKINFSITHQSIANMAGITRETASLQLKEIEGRKALNNNRDHLVIHTDRLQQLLLGE